MPEFQLASDRHPVLLLHGQPGSPRDWDRVVSGIGSRAQVLAITRPGWQPRSAPQDLAGNAAAALSALDQAGMARAVVVGHSLGGAVAAWLAAHEPDRVAALVLVAPAADMRSLTAIDRVLAAPVVGDVLSAAFLTGSGLALGPARIRRVIAGRLGLDPGYLRSSRAVLLRPAAWRSFLAEQRMLIRDLPLLDRHLEDIIAPTTVVAGTEDRIVPIASARAVANRIRGAQLVELRGAHHLVHQQRAAELAELIVAATSL